MNNPNDFVIKNGILKKYKGKDPVVTVPDGVTSIGNEAFCWCLSLNSVTLPDGVTRIGEKAFYWCSSLNSVTLPEGLTSIGESAFYDCSSLQSVTIPVGITSIGGWAFHGCESLHSVTFPLSLKKIGKEAFKYCEKLETVSVQPGGIITYAANAFGENPWTDSFRCKKLRYTPEMFMNTGRLSDSFAEHLDVCTPEALVWVYIYQEGELWEKALAKHLTAENAPAVLAAMTEMIKTAKSPKKAASAAAAFVRANVLLLSGEGIAALLETLRSRKQTAIADELAADPIISAKLSSGETPENADEVVLPDGTVLCGKLEQPVAAGSVFDFGTDQPIWRILSVDKDADTALVIADSPLSYSDFERFENNSDEYFHSAFSDAEREAILETEIEEDGKAEKTHFFFLEEEEMGRCSRIFPDGNDYWFSPGGGILYEFDGVYGDNTIGERPAFYIDLQSEAFRSMLSKGRSGEPVIPGYALQIKAGELFHVHPLVGEVKLPAYVKKIGSYACFRCYALTSVSWEGTR